MKMELAQVVNKGMQRDYAMNTASQEFAYENKNIRITSTGNESFLSVTNEKSTIPIVSQKFNFLKFSNDGWLYFEYPVTSDVKVLVTSDKKKQIINDKGEVEIVYLDYTVTVKTGETVPNNIGFGYGENDLHVTRYNIDSSTKQDDCYYYISYNERPDSSLLKPSVKGDVLGSTTISDYLVLFVKHKDVDYIYRLTLNKDHDIYTADIVFSGDLNFGVANPIECISYYESEEVQKVYWVDGLNQPRVINIMELGQTSNTSNLDFVPKIEKQPVVTIEKEQNGAGLFPSGVVQYYITYYKKFNQETHTAYTSPLYYISPNDRGGEADSIQTCSFRIRITDVDPKYDYARVYSLVRTSKNSDYVVSIVGDVNIKNSEDTYQIIDTNTNLINVPSSDILFLGGNVIIPSTIEQKDNTLFLGNITTGTNIIRDEIEALKKYFREIEHGHDIEMYNLLKFVYKVVPVKNEDNTTLYPYNPNLESNLYDTHFKLREKYRVGIQLINDVGENSQTIYIGDVINENHYPHYMSQDVVNDFSFDYNNLKKVDNHYIDKSGNIHLYDILDETSSYSDYLCLPIITFNDLIFEGGNHIESTLLACKEKGFTNYRLVIAETDYKDRSILCQGYVNPLSFRLDRRKTNDCYNQESWTIRPIGEYKHLENVNKCEEDSDGSFNYTEDSEIRSSLDKDHYKQNCIVNSKDEGDLIKSITTTLYIDIQNNLIYKDTFSITLYITVRGKNSENNDAGVTFYETFSDGRSGGYFEYEEMDRAISAFDMLCSRFGIWDDKKLKKLKDVFGNKLDDVVLKEYGFIPGERIPSNNFIVTSKMLKDTFDANDYLVTDTSAIVKEETINYYFSFYDTNIDISKEYGENFYLDASKCSLNTPDLENISDILSSTPNLKCRIVGKIDIDRITSDQYLNVDKLGDGKIYNVDYSKILTKEDDYFGIKSFIGVQSGGDKKAYKLMMLDKDGSIDNTENLILKNKRVGNLWYASKTDYEFHWRYIKEDHYDKVYIPSINSEYKNFKKESEIYNEKGYSDIQKWGWYSGLIYHDIDLKNKGVYLWNKDLYINNETTLKNIEDNTYNPNWSLLRTNEGVGSLYYKDKLESLINYNDGIIEKQNQIQIKYNTSDSILLDLQTYNSDLHFLPGYTNYELKGTLKPLWINTPLVSTNIIAEVLRCTDLTSEDLIPLFKDSSAFYIKKEKVRVDQTKDEEIIFEKYYYIFNEVDTTTEFPYYVNRVVQAKEFSKDVIQRKEEEESIEISSEYYYKFELAKKGNSYTAYDYSEHIYTNDSGLHPLYNIITLTNENNNYNLDKNKYFYIKNLFSGLIDSDKVDYLFNLQASLRGNYFLYRDGSSRTFGIGFVPNNNFKHYLPFNLKGKAGFDYPNYVTEGNYSLNSAGYFQKNVIEDNNGINNSLWVCELYKDFDDFEFLGGTSENAIELNTFIPASQVCPIGSTIYGLYGDTYFKRWDNLRVYPMNDEQTNGIVDVVSLMLETHVNLDGDIRSARKRLDITNMRPSNMEGLVNPVYSQSNNVITSNVLDDKFNVSSHPLQYWWSLPKTNLSEIDNWTQVNLTSVGELDGDKGSLNKIKRWNNYLFAFQDKGIAQINFNNQTVIGGQEGIPVEIANSGKVQGHYYITTNNGCKNKWSIVESPAGLYFIDSYNKSIMLLGDGLKSLSQLNLFQDWIEKNEQGNIWNPIRVSNKHAFKSFYDPIHSEVYFANGEHCLCYNELLQQFTSFYDYENLNYMFLLDGHIYGINYRYSSSDPIQLHKMFEGEDYCNLFGKQCEYYMQYKINKDPFVDKTWTNLEYRADIFNTGNIQSNKDYASDNILSNETFDTLKVWNEYQSGKLDLNKVRMNYLKDAKSRFRVWRTNIPRANKSETNKHGLDRIRNPWIMLELKKTGDTSKRMEFHDLIIKYVI